MKNLTIRNLALSSFIIFSFAISTSFANEPVKDGNKEELKAKIQAAKEEVNKACLADAEKAGCKDKEVGSGLMKCMKEYKEKNKDFKLSDSCKEASKNLHHERRNKHKKDDK